MDLLIIVKAQGPQASSLTAGEGWYRINLERNNMDKQLEKNLKKIEGHETAWQLNRVANAMEEIIQMVKKDQQETRERFEKRWDKEDE